MSKLTSRQYDFAWEMVHESHDIEVLRLVLIGVLKDAEAMKGENAGLRLLLERIQHDELKVELALAEEQEIRQALWAIASVDLTKEELDEWACGLDERVRSAIEQMGRSS